MKDAPVSGHTGRDCGDQVLSHGPKLKSSKSRRIQSNNHVFWILELMTLASDWSASSCYNYSRPGWRPWHKTRILHQKTRQNLLLTHVDPCWPAETCWSCEFLGFSHVQPLFCEPRNSCAKTQMEAGPTSPRTFCWRDRTESFGRTFWEQETWLHCWLLGLFALFGY